MSVATQPACWPPTNSLTDDVRTLYGVLVMLRDGAAATDEASATEAFGLIADVVRIILRRLSFSLAAVKRNFLLGSTRNFSLGRDR